MAIVQISKIQQRSGNLVDLPQLDEAEFGWASDAKRLFIGKTTPNENVEVLTSYSQINYSQINGSVGNLNISNVTIADGQALIYDGNNWVNRGGDAGGLITLGDASNVKITGGAIGYVLETDGLGNLSWTPKSTIIAYIQNVTKANPAVVTTTQDNFLTDGVEITITDASGMTELNGNSYYANVLSSNSFSLYSDPSLTVGINSTGFGTYSFTTAASTSASTNRVTIGNSALFSVNQEVLFLGGLSTSGLENNVSYYVKSAPSGTTITLSEELLANGVAGNTKSLTTATLTGANVYAAGGRAIASVGGAGSTSLAAYGSTDMIQYNVGGLLRGNGSFTFNEGSTLLSLTGNANVGNLNATGIVTSTRMISNIATGTSPLAVTSTTRVANLNVSHSNVSDFQAVTAQTTGTFYPVFVNGSSSANYALGANANISFNAATGNLSVTLLNVAANANVGNLGTSTAIITTGNITTINSGLLQNGNSNVTITANANVTINANGGARITATTTGANITGTLDVSGNANVGNIGATNANITAMTATGNVTAANFIGIFANGNSDVNIPAANGNINFDVTGNANVVVMTATGINVAGTLNATGNANVGNLGTAGLIVATGNVTGGNLTTDGALSVTGNANVGNIGATTAIFTTGNITTINSGLLQNGTSNVVVAAAGGNVTLGVAGTATIIATSTGANITGTGNITGNANVGNLGTAGLVVATGNVTGGNLVTGGVLSVTGNANVGNLGTAGLVVATGNVTGGNLVTAGVVAATGNVSGANVVVTSYHIRSINGAVSAAGTVQGDATALTKEINVVSTVETGAGVVLPAAVAGMVLIINNTSANTLNVYPASGGAINLDSTNAAYLHTSGASIQYYATSGTQWYTVGATFA
jgi:hypothetical protein